ncbi:MAG TPA: hypothetical protein VGL71_07410, partial [Urbifossiella sp.]
MEPIVIDETQKAKLNGLTEATPVRDQNGRLLGQFVPQQVYKKLLYGWAWSLFTEKEIEDAKKRIIPG